MLKIQDFNPHAKKKYEKCSILFYLLVYMNIKIYLICLNLLKGMGIKSCIYKKYLYLFVVSSFCYAIQLS